MEFEADTAPSPLGPECSRLLAIPAYVLSLGLLAAVALHSWPVGGRPALQVFWPANFLLLLWAAVLSLLTLSGRLRRQVQTALPPACVWAYVLVCLLSIAAANHPSRAATAAAKIALSLVGGYTLLQIGLSSPGKLNRGMLVFTWAVAGVVAHAAWERLAGRPVRSLFGSELKLGTFLAMGLPLVWVYLVDSPGRWRRLASVVILAAGLAVCGTVWAFAGTCLGVLTSIAFSGSERWRRHVVLLIPVALGIGLLAGFGRLDPVVSDARLQESGGHLRQRYLEWQAQLNLLSDRSAAGTGIGCLNDRRGEYYHRLPKRNTIAEFDENGWLVVASETGFLGLVCFCWIVRDYLVEAVRRRRVLVVRAALAGFVGAMVAGVASAVQYSGLLVVFALLLALIDQGGRLREQDSCA